MRKIVKLTENDLTRIIKRVIQEQAEASVLKLGSKGPEVGALQKKLGIPVDNDFGVNTEAAVKAFQTKNGLTADGIVGPGTVAKLGLGAGTEAGKSTAFKAGKKTKEILIKVGKVVITIVFLPIGVAVLIAGVIYKLAAAAVKALISFITSLAKLTNQIIIQPAIELTKATGELLVKLGVGLFQAGVFVVKAAVKLVDETAKIITKILGAIWGVGKWIFLTALTQIRRIPELFNYVADWVNQKGRQVAKLLGKTWEFITDAFDKGKQEVINAAKKGLETGKKIVDFIGNAVDTAVTAGKDFVKGFMSEGYVDVKILREHYNYYSKLSTSQVLRESYR